MKQVARIERRAKSGITVARQAFVGSEIGQPARQTMTLHEDERREGEQIHGNAQNRSWGWVLAFVVALAVLAGVFAYSFTGERARTVDRGGSTTGQSTQPAKPAPPAR